MTVYSLYDEGDKKTVTLNGIDTITAFALIDPVLQPKEKSEFQFCAFASQTNKFIMVILNKDSQLKKLLSSESYGVFFKKNYN